MSDSGMLGERRFSEHDPMDRRPNRRGTPATRPTGVQTRIRQMLVLERLSTRLPRVAAQLTRRHDDRPTLRLDDEHDLQDLAHAMLALEHDDIRVLSWAPDYAEGRERRDFWLKLESVVFEARWAWPGLDAEALGAQLTADRLVHRPRTGCTALACLIYDPDGLCAAPRAIEQALSRDVEGVTVRVFIAPRP